LRRSAFSEIADNIYINTEYPGDREETIELINRAKERIKEFFGNLCCLDETVIADTTYPAIGINSRDKWYPLLACLLFGGKKGRERY
jgi:hypothetical protein